MCYIIILAGLSAGATAAVVIFVLLLIIAALVGGVCYMKGKNVEFNRLLSEYQAKTRSKFRKSGNAAPNNPGFDNVAYVNKSSEEESQIHNNILDSP